MTIASRTPGSRGKYTVNKVLYYYVNFASVLVASTNSCPLYICLYSQKHSHGIWLVVDDNLEFCLRAIFMDKSVEIFEQKRSVSAFLHNWRTHHFFLPLFNVEILSLHTATWLQHGQGGRGSKCGNWRCKTHEFNETVFFWEWQLLVLDCSFQKGLL